MRAMAIAVPAMRRAIVPAPGAIVTAIVMIATAVVWVGGDWLGGRLGWDYRYAFLLDFAAIAAFVWALVVTWRIWRRRQGN